jgi:hypothetical protein
VSRDTVLAQFTPSVGARRVSAAERIDLLVTTDLLSEGLNLQEASVVVHLDLPWNPARLDQRVGRVLRLGSRHETVHAYVVSPPASAERLLRIEERLRDKLGAARRTVGVAGQILPSPVGVLVDDRESGLAERAGTIAAKLRDWGMGAGGAGMGAASLASSVLDVSPSGPDPVVAAVRSDITGFLALIQDEGGARLVANIGNGVETSVAAIGHAIDAAGGAEVAPSDAAVVQVFEQLGRWLATQRGASAVDFAAAIAARSRRSALARVAQALARTPRHRRALLAQLADAARAVAVAPLAEGAERILETLVRADLPDEAWLRSIAAFGELNVRPGPIVGGDSPRILAVILFQIG